MGQSQAQLNLVGRNVSIATSLKRCSHSSRTGSQRRTGDTDGIHGGCRREVSNSNACFCSCEGELAGHKAAVQPGRQPWHNITCKRTSFVGPLQLFCFQTNLKLSMADAERPSSPTPEEREKLDKEAKKKEEEEQSKLPYKWSQQIGDLDLTAPIPGNIKGRDLDVKITKSSLKAGIKGQEPIVDVHLPYPTLSASTD